MIAPEDSTADTMLKAVSTSIAALDAAATLDVDRSDEDRAFFATERDTLKGQFDVLSKADTDARMHLLLVALVEQARVQIGDAVLDRGTSQGKARMKVELKSSTMPDGADHVFGSDVSDITGAKMAEEPGLVLDAVAKFGQVPDFAGKSEMATDLTVRATQQTKNFNNRRAAAVKEAELLGAVELTVKACSQALYRLEKRLLDRFPRQTKYVKAFFYDVAPAKKKATTPAEPVPTTGG
jgi:hypothetical protein